MRNVKTQSRAAGLRKIWSQHRSTLLFFALMFCFRSAWADWVRVPTGSMNPTIVEGDRLLVNKHAYGLRIPFTLTRVTAGEEPARGDIVVFDSPADGVSLVKRLIAVPGDVVMLDDEVLVVNGRRATYAPGDAARLRALLQSTQAREPAILREAGPGPEHDILLLPVRAPQGRFGPVRVPAGMYFMLGDNRDNSADSRYIGFVPRRNIVGRASRVVVSFNAENYYLPRLERLLTPLG